MACAEAKRAKQTRYYRANVEARRTAQRAYNLANAQVIREKEALRREAHTPEQRTRLEQLKAAWAARNPAKVKASSVAARHARRAAAGRFTASQWQLLCALYGHQCAACDADEKLTPDHIVALARGGSNHIANIQPLCLDCNRRKGTKGIVFGFQPHVNPAAMLSDPEAWLSGEPAADTVMPIVYQNGAVQPLLFSAEESE